MIPNWTINNVSFEENMVKSKDARRRHQGKRKRESWAVKRKNKRKLHFDVHPDNSFQQKSELKPHAGI